MKEWRAESDELAGSVGVHRCTRVPCDCADTGREAVVMGKKEENQRKAIKELLAGIEYRNRKILRLLEENRYLRQKNFEYFCALQWLGGGPKVQPYGGFTDDYIKRLIATAERLPIIMSKEFLQEMEDGE